MVLKTRNNAKVARLYGIAKLRENVRNKRKVGHVEDQGKSNNTLGAYHSAELMKSVV